MAYEEDTWIGGGQRRFPTTHWSQLAKIRDEPTAEHQAVLNFLIQSYWKPVYCYLRYRKYGNEDAKDLTQKFFTDWLQKGLFGKVDTNLTAYNIIMIAHMWVLKGWHFKRRFTLDQYIDLQLATILNALKT